MWSGGQRPVSERMAPRRIRVTLSTRPGGWVNKTKMAVARCSGREEGHMTGGERKRPPSAHTHTHAHAGPRTWRREENEPRGRGQKKMKTSGPGVAEAAGRPRPSLGHLRAQLTALGDVLTGWLLENSRR